MNVSLTASQVKLWLNVWRSKALKFMQTLYVRMNVFIVHYRSFCALCVLLV